MAGKPGTRWTADEQAALASIVKNNPKQGYRTLAADIYWCCCRVGPKASYILINRSKKAICSALRRYKATHARIVQDAVQAAEARHDA